MAKTIALKRLLQPQAFTIDFNFNAMVIVIELTPPFSQKQGLFLSNHICQVKLDASM
jgi:hypothetical protein